VVVYSKWARLNYINSENEVPLLHWRLQCNEPRAERHLYRVVPNSLSKSCALDNIYIRIYMMKEMYTKLLLIDLLDFGYCVLHIYLIQGTTPLLPAGKWYRRNFSRNAMIALICLTYCYSLSIFREIRDRGS